MSPWFKWWLYVIVSIVLLFFLAPAMISAQDTIIVLLGVVSLVLLGVWSWRLWIKGSIVKLKEMYEKASRD